jgi:hypothetical protein
MLRRLYYIFPIRKQVESAVEELKDLGIDQKRMHTIAREDIDISELPPATVRQRSDFGARLEVWMWDLNLLLFFTAAGALVFTLFFSLWYWGLGLALVMAASFLLGNHFATHIPKMHLSGLRAALNHGEILLLVDVPRWHVREVEATVLRHHPEAGIGGVGWTLEALHI